MQPLHSAPDYDALRALPVALVYKHSGRCPISLLAYQEIERIHAAHPDVPLFVIDVLRNRAVAQHVARDTGVQHQSPQLILLAHGDPVWSVSHFDVRAEALAERIRRAQAA